MSSAVGDLPRAVRVLDAWGPVVVDGPKERRTAVIAGRQSGRAARWQLLTAGVTDRMIRTMRRNGELIPRLPGVYAVGHAAPAEFARETEALLCFSMPAVLSHLSAARVWGLLPPSRPQEPVDVLVHRDTKVRQPLIRSHRTKQLDRKDVRIQRGLPVTSPARTLVDVTPLVSDDDELEHMLDEALEHNLVRITQIREVIARYGAGRPGVHRLVVLLDERQGRSSALSRSFAERRLRDLLKLAGIAPDEMNVDLHGHVPDMVWREAKLIVEIDGYAHHRARSRFEADRRKDALLATHGWLTLRFTARRIRDEPYAVIAEIALMLGRRLEVAQRAA